MGHSGHPDDFITQARLLLEVKTLTLDYLLAQKCDNNSSVPTIKYRQNSSPIQISTSEKLLGVTVDSSLNWNAHIERTIENLFLCFTC